MIQASAILARICIEADKAHCQSAQVIANASKCMQVKNSSRRKVCGPVGRPRLMMGSASGCISKMVIQIDQTIAAAQRKGRCCNQDRICFNVKALICTLDVESG